MSDLLIKEEITLAIALELARYSHDIQKHVYDNHLSQDKDDTYSWKGLSAKEFTRLLENGYSADLSQYEFDKGDCQLTPRSSICLQTDTVDIVKICLVCNKTLDSPFFKFRCNVDCQV